MCRPWSAATPDSVAAARLAIQLEFIWKVNNCCDSCGGKEYEKPIDIDWPNREVGGGKFDATFNGQEWEISLPFG